MRKEKVIPVVICPKCGEEIELATWEEFEELKRKVEKLGQEIEKLEEKLK